MKQLVTIIVGSSMVAHSIFGCCDHIFASPSQGVVGHCHCHVKFAASHEHGDAHSNHRSSEPHSSQQENPDSCDNCGLTEQGQVPGGQHVCRHANCHWLSSNSSPTVSPLNLDIYFAAPTPPPVAAASPSEWQRSTDFAVGRICVPPLRLHLAIGVLLI
jgi:hypothetical protein